MTPTTVRRMTPTIAGWFKIGRSAFSRGLKGKPRASFCQELHGYERNFQVNIDNNNEAMWFQHTTLLSAARPKSPKAPQHWWCIHTCEDFSRRSKKLQIFLARVKTLTQMPLTLCVREFSPEKLGKNWRSTKSWFSRCEKYTHQCEYTITLLAYDSCGILKERFWGLTAYLTPNTCLSTPRQRYHVPAAEQLRRAMLPLPLPYKKPCCHTLTTDCLPAPLRTRHYMEPCALYFWFASKTNTEHDSV